MRYGLVSSKAVSRVRSRPPGDGRGLPPSGAVGAGHINENQTPRRSSGLTNPTSDYGPSDLGHINQKINKRNWKYKLRGENPFRTADSLKPNYSPRWFDWQSRIAWSNSGKGTPPKADEMSGGPMPDEDGASGRGWYDRNRRGGA